MLLEDDGRALADKMTNMSTFRWFILASKEPVDLATIIYAHGKILKSYHADKGPIDKRCQHLPSTSDYIHTPGLQPGVASSQYIIFKFMQWSRKRKPHPAQ